MLTHFTGIRSLAGFQAGIFPCRTWKWAHQGHVIIGILILILILILIQVWTWNTIIHFHSNWHSNHALRGAGYSDSTFRASQRWGHYDSGRFFTVCHNWRNHCISISIGILMGIGIINSSQMIGLLMGSIYFRHFEDFFAALIWRRRLVQTNHWPRSWNDILVNIICNISGSGLLQTRMRNIWVFFSSRSLKTRKKSISFAQFVNFLREVCLLFIFEW